MAELDGPRFGPASGGTPRQLVVLLHGVGADGHDLIDLAPSWAPALPDAVFVSPHAPEPYEAGGPGRQWFSLGARDRSRMVAGVAAVRAVLDRFLDATLADLAMSPEALALVGFSQGAMTALHVGLRRRPIPRAIVAYSGILLDQSGLAAPFPPVLLLHGEADEVVPVAATRDAHRVLRDVGAPVDMELSPRLGHGIDAVGLSRGGLFLQRAFAQTD